MRNAIRFSDHAMKSTMTQQATHIGMIIMGRFHPELRYGADYDRHRKILNI